jgi:hypothetical protein
VYGTQDTASFWNNKTNANTEISSAEKITTDATFIVPF